MPNVAFQRQREGHLFKATKIINERTKRKNRWFLDLKKEKNNTHKHIENSRGTSNTKCVHELRMGLWKSRYSLSSATVMNNRKRKHVCNVIG